MILLKLLSQKKIKKEIKILTFKIYKHNKLNYNIQVLINKNKRKKNLLKIKNIYKVKIFKI